MLTHNVDVNAKNNEGMTALHHTAKYNHQRACGVIFSS
ncbi:hypothetical protein [Wolbachia pipientis]